MFLNLDSEIIPKEDVVRRASLSRENMRTVTVQLNSDIFDRIQKLAREEEESREDLSKVTNELLGLGLRNYNKLFPNERPNNE